MTGPRQPAVHDDPINAAALAMARSLVEIAHQPDPDFRAVDARRFPGYMRQHAQKVQRQLEREGFVLLGDFEIVNLRKILGQTLMIRLMRSADATIDAAIYSIRPRWPGVVGAIWRRLRGQFRTLRAVEFETHFPGARSMTTNNQGAANTYSYPAAVDVLCLPAGTAVAKVLAEHRRRLMQRSSRVCQEVPLRIENWDQRQRLAAGVAQRKREFRRAIGYVTDAELQAQCGEGYEQFAHKIRAYIQELVGTVEAVEGLPVGQSSLNGGL